jgi:RNA polymerase sigma factor (sigma-70 family)
MSTPSSEPLSSPPCVVHSDQTKWFKDEVHPHDGQLKNYLKAQFPGVRDVEDVVQESYLRIWKAKAVQPIRSAKAFLFDIARHLAIDLYRRSKTQKVEQLGDLAALHVIDSRPDAAQTLTLQERMDLLTDAVVALPTRSREVILLHKIKGLTQREVAVRLGISERTVENLCRIGTMKCAVYLRARGIEGFQSH